MAATHVVFSYYWYTVLLDSERDRENNQSTHIFICMYEPYKYKNAKTVTHEDFGGGLFATINTTTAVQAQKNKNVERFLMGQKHRWWRALFTCF